MNGFTDLQPEAAPFTFSHGGQDWPGQCVYGHFQSPIDITDFPSNPDQLRIVTNSNSSFSPYTSNMRSVPTSSLSRLGVGGFLTWMVFDMSLTETVAGYTFTHTVMDIRVSAPSEHTINGMRYPLAVHLAFVVRHPDAVIFLTLFMQIMFKEGSESGLLEALEDEDGNADFRELFPTNGVLDDYYTYAGSMDRPVQGCTEGFTWVIPNYVLEASSAQIARWQNRTMSQDFSQGYGNIRALQPLGSRTLYHYVPGESSQSFLR